MVFDSQALLSDLQAVTSTANSTNTYDAGVARDMVAGEPVWLVVQVTTAFAAEGAATLTVSIVTASDAAFTSPSTIYTSPAIPVAALTLGARPVATQVPRPAERYL